MSHQEWESGRAGERERAGGIGVKLRKITASQDHPSPPSPPSPLDWRSPPASFGTRGNNSPPSSLLPLSRSPALPLSRSPALPLSRSPALPLSRSPALPLSRSPAKGLK